MATFTRQSAADMTVQANWDTWMGDIRTQLAAFGWIQTSDTGQTNPVGATVPSANNTYPYYEIWKTGDALTVWNMRVDYGRGNGTNYPAVKIKLGTTTNGSGTITGKTTSSYTVTYNNTAITPERLFLSGDTFRFGMQIGSGNGNNNQVCFISIHRSVDSSGAPNDNGMEVFSCLGLVSTPTYEFVHKTENSYAQVAYWICANIRGTSTLGTHYHIGIPISVSETVVNSPSLAVITFSNTDISVGVSTTQAFTLYGASHTFLLNLCDGGAFPSGGNMFTGWRYE